MRRLLPAVLAAVLATLLLLPTGVATADVAATARQASGDVLLLATEGEGEPVGPEPDLQNTNAPPEYQPPFLINAAFGLTALMVALVVALGGLYYLLVHRPRQRQGG